MDLVLFLPADLRFAERLLKKVRLLTNCVRFEVVDWTDNVAYDTPLGPNGGFDFQAFTQRDQSAVADLPYRRERAKRRAQDHMGQGSGKRGS
ncbi:unnamed protein product, partial [Prunus brigantina]